MYCILLILLIKTIRQFFKFFFNLEFFSLTKYFTYFVDLLSIDGFYFFHFYNIVIRPIKLVLFKMLLLSIQLFFRKSIKKLNNIFVLDLSYCNFTVALKFVYFFLFKYNDLEYFHIVPARIVKVKFDNHINLWFKINILL